MKGQENFTKTTWATLTSLSSEVDILRLLGYGSKAITYYVKDYKLNSYAVLKSYDKAKLEYFKFTVKDVRNELAALENMPKHPNMCGYYRSFETDLSVNFVIEYCGKMSFAKFIEEGTVNESQAKFILKQILDGVIELAKHNIYHQDLAAVNIMINHDLTVKIIDFGTLRKGNDLGYDYSLPQPEFHSYELSTNTMTTHEASDAWSIGVIAYYAVFGVFPFDRYPHPNSHEQIASLHFLKLATPVTTPSFKDFISNIFVPMDRRLSFKEMRNHPWITSEFPSENNDDKDDSELFK